MINAQACNCHRCGRDLNPNTATFEAQESLVISFRAGYGSIFGDGNIVSSILCQHSINEVLGSWLDIKQDDPFNPQIALAAPRAAYQPNQIFTSQPGQCKQQQGGDGRELFPQLQALYERNKHKLYSDE